MDIHLNRPQWVRRNFLTTPVKHRTQLEKLVHAVSLLFITATAASRGYQKLETLFVKGNCAVNEAAKKPQEATHHGRWPLQKSNYLS